jgi:zinc/manganese transport system substrate-binding protein
MFRITALFGAWAMFSMAAGVAEGKVRVLTTTANTAALAKSIGKDLIDVDSLTKGGQDPHFVEAKPSFMVAASKADLIISEGLDLEVGWLPAVLKGSRNRRVMPGADGSLELGAAIEPLEIPTGPVSREHGDVHPGGNPHFMLDPVRVANLATIVAERLAKIDPTHDMTYKQNAIEFRDGLLRQTETWRLRVKASGVKEVIAYHKTLTYFFAAFGLSQAGSLEPKPGVPPTANHILDLIATVKQKKIGLIMLENFFDPSPASKVKELVPAVRIEVVPVSVGGEPGIQTLDQLYERLVTVVEGKNVSDSN